MPHFANILRSAVPFGGGVAVLALLIAGGAWVFRAQSRHRLEALKRANPQDVPRIIGDELDQFNLPTDKITGDQQFKLASDTLAQREARSQRTAALAIILAIFCTIVVLVGIVLPPAGPVPSSSPPITSKTARSATPMSTTSSPIPSTRVSAPPKRSEEPPEVFPLKAVDADYELWVLPRYYAWKFEDAENLIFAKEEELLGYLRSPGISERVRCALGLIAVGSASEESEEGEAGYGQEENRADARARKTLHWVSMALPPIMPLWRLNLGWHDATGSTRRRITLNDAGVKGEETAYQRSFMIILVMNEKSDNVDHEKSLREAILTKPEIPYMHYSKKDRFNLVIESSFRAQRQPNCPAF